VKGESLLKSRRLQMLNIYTDRNLVNKPIISDCESVFAGFKLKDTEFTRTVLDKIEHGEYVDEDVFKDRFGRNLYINCLSTSSKTLLLANEYKDYAIDCDELGTNALDLLLLCPNATVYFGNRDVEFKSKLDCVVRCNNVEFSSTYNLNEFLAGGENLNDN
jgi:hypothetical protein